MSRFEVIRGVEGCCLALDDTRIAGSKPWGGGKVIHAWETDKEYKEIVRCKDCIFKAYDGNWCYRTAHEFMIKPDGFCSWAERR